MIPRSTILLAIAASAVAHADDAVTTRAPVPATTASAETRAVHSWELPALVVQGERGAELREEDLVGSYGQPRWTARRRFTEARAYVVPEGQIEFEYWLVLTQRRDGGPTQRKQIYEVEMGLPHRFQLDLYQVWEKDGAREPQEMSETKFEVRWALADWGVIRGNPTLYAEWVSANGDYDSAEGKLLLADEIAPRWHWAANLVYERKLGGDEAVSREAIAAISYSVLDEKLSIGAEAKLTWEDTNEDRGNYARDQLVGPSVQYRPLPQMHLDLAYLLNTAPHDESSTRSKMTFIAGWEF
jgi:hypothetical protein